ncbi:MAG TPA: substrate-binding domain-containing protein [Conexibacter sp.]|nr:substrate-binding domain-containing protein [Conexibacter sp.]
MSRLQPGTRRRVAATAVAAALAATGLSACGSSSGDDDAKTTAATTTAVTTATTGAGGDAAAEIVAEARAPLSSFDGPATPPGPVPSGKELAVIYPLPAPLPQNASAGVVTAAEAVGWKTRLIDGKGTPKGYVDAIDQAISAGVDGIVLVAMPVELLQQQIKAAGAAGIPVVAALPGLAEPTPPERLGLFDYVRADYEQQGTTLGNWVVAEAPDGAEAIRLESAEFSDLTHESQQFAATLESAGPQYEIVEVVSSPVTDILGGPQGVQRLAAALRKHPDARYVFILSESWSQIFIQAKRLTGRDDVVGLGSDGDVSVPLVAKGEELVMIGPDSRTYGWYAVDALIRAFNDEPAVHYELRSQLVDTTNAGEVRGAGITAAYDYEAEWKRLWGDGE